MLVGIERYTRGLWPLDWCHLCYLAVSILLLWQVRVDAQGAIVWIIVNVFLALAVFWLHGLTRSMTLRRRAVFRMIYMIVVIPTVFTQLGSIIPFLNPTPWEHDLHALDKAICFGVNPVEACEALATPWLTEIMQWIYDFYYFIPILLGVIMVRRGSAMDLVRMMFAFVICVYTSYVGYYLVPATGPNINKYGLYEFSSDLPGLFLATELRDTLFVIEKIKQDCFPSGHTAVSLLALTLAWRYRRGLVPILAPFVVGLIFSTVYLRYHYLTDVLAGCLLAIAAHFAAIWLHRGFERRMGAES